MAESTRILGLSGKKQSGKTTTSNFLLGKLMRQTGIVQGHCFCDERGRLNISDIYGNEEGCGIFDPYLQTEAMQNFLAEEIDPIIRLYSFADALKQDVCISLLGLTWAQCYGTDKDKNTLTNLKWQNMPGFQDYCHNLSESDPVLAGHMTAREVMQYVGSEVFRKMYPNIWVDVTIKRILEYGSVISVITDCRFPNECDAIHKVGGQILRLERAPFANDDVHISETALDDYEDFDLVLKDCHSIDEHCRELNKLLKDTGYIL